uniref:Uncharacterized protein n=1 Tax=Molossus molossus TaxID=27622 RepID=A0A7J8ERV0_MOLMO|nr:hypothetical protein HJG59_008783 [Molossus molossus]
MPTPPPVCPPVFPMPAAGPSQTVSVGVLGVQGEGRGQFVKTCPNGVCTVRVPPRAPAGRRPVLRAPQLCTAGPSCRSVGRSCSDARCRPLVLTRIFLIASRVLMGMGTSYLWTVHSDLCWFSVGAVECRGPRTAFLAAAAPRSQKPERPRTWSQKATHEL